MPLDLAVAGARLCQQLGGSWFGQSGVCRCPAHPDRTPSLSVRVGTKALLFKCHAGCPQSAVLATVRSVLRVCAPQGSEGQQAGRPCKPDVPKSWIHALWDQALPLRGTLGAGYFEARGLCVPEDAPLRFLPRCWHRPSRRLRPAVLAASQTLAGTIQSLHRIYLHPDGRRLSPTSPARMLTNAPQRSAVQLAPATSVLGLAEGVETALAAGQIHGLPVWAALSSARLHRLELPDGVEELVLFGDNDDAGRAGVARAQACYAAPGRTIQACIPDPPLNDWADLLKTS